MTDQDGQNTAGSAGQQALKTIPQAAAFLGKSERTVRRWVKAGKLQTVDIAGQVYVQPDSLDRLASVAGATVETLSNDTHKQANMSGTVQVLPDKLEQVYKDRIDGLERENGRLWQQVTSLQNTLDNVTRALPAPKNPTEVSGPPKKGYSLWFYIVLMLAVAAIAYTLGSVLISG